MDPAILSAASALMGSLVGGAASLCTAWITQTTQSKRDSAAAELRKRESLYGEYVTECSKLIVDSIDHSLDHPSTMVTALAILNRIRLTASPPVMEAAEASLNAIIQSYFKDNMTLAQLNAQLRDGTRKYPDPLEKFSAACRIELWGVHRIR
jgi:hypothetical protein